MSAPAERCREIAALETRCSREAGHDGDHDFSPNEGAPRGVSRMTTDVKAALLLAHDALIALKRGHCWCAFTREPRQHHSAACDNAGEALVAIRVVLEGSRGSEP